MMENTDYVYKVESVRFREALLTMLLINRAFLGEDEALLEAYERLRLKSEVNLVSIQGEMQIYLICPMKSYHSRVCTMLSELYDLGYTTYKDKENLDIVIKQTYDFLTCQLRELYSSAYYEVFSWLGDPVAYKEMEQIFGEVGKEIYIPRIVVQDYTLGTLRALL